MDAATITAIGTAIAVIVAALVQAYISISNSRAARADAAEAKANTAATLAAAENTAKKVDGQTHELLNAVKAQAGAEATLAERDAAHVRTGEAAVSAASVVQPEIQDGHK